VQKEEEEEVEAIVERKTELLQPSSAFLEPRLGEC